MAARSKSHAEGEEWIEKKWEKVIKEEGTRNETKEKWSQECLNCGERRKLENKPKRNY